MAITLADFDKIWASTSPLTPYSFSESNYKQGWNFIGSTPPARQMWDFLQKNNDEKMKYLADNYLPLSGGTMTGELVFGSGTGQGHLGQSSDYFRVSATKFAYADNPGAGLILRGRTAANDAGAFALEAKSNSGDKTLIGKPDGTLTWDGKEVERVNASGSGYIRYESGLQICFGESPTITATGDYTITLPVAFNSVNYSVSFGREWANNWNENYYCKAFSTTYFTLTVIGTASTNNHKYRYIAVGYWK